MKTNEGQPRNSGEMFVVNTDIFNNIKALFCLSSTTLIVKEQSGDNLSLGKLCLNTNNFLIFPTLILLDALFFFENIICARIVSFVN